MNKLYSGWFLIALLMAIPSLHAQQQSPASGDLDAVSQQQSPSDNVKVKQFEECGLGCDGGGDEPRPCSSYNNTFYTSFNFTLSGNYDHNTGLHSVTWPVSQTCTYTPGTLSDGEGGVYCNTNATTSYGSITFSETGFVAPAVEHLVGWNQLSNNLYVANGGSDTSGEVAWSVIGCDSNDPGCQHISISFSGQSPVYTPHEGAFGFVVWESTQAQGAIPVLDCPTKNDGDGESPIVIDLEGKDFVGAFTSVEEGIVWDFAGNGNLRQMSWTNKGRNIGFLALDRNENGRIDNARELFGNLTNQPLSEEQAAMARATRDRSWPSNGFYALGVFDREEYGGNGDGKIDSNDAIWPKLRVWVDTCHNGDSTCGTMYTLDDLGIVSISLAFRPSSEKDEYGNQMRYEGTVKMQHIMNSPVRIYDVFFKSAPIHR